MTERTLLVFAHADEAAAFAQEGVPHMITGVGKVNSAIELTNAILEMGSEAAISVTVLGTAGAIHNSASLDTVYRISSVFQHDFSLPSPTLSLPNIRPLTSGVPTAAIATGDVFVQSDTQREQIAATGASLVDMESYAYARVCERFGVPLQIFKTPSDFADSSTTQDSWDDVVISKSDQLMQFARTYLPEILRENGR